MPDCFASMNKGDWYAIRGRKNFTGPQIAANEVEHDSQIIGGGCAGRVMTDDVNGAYVNTHSKSLK